jgi:hypothetical protein
MEEFMKTNLSILMMLTLVLGLLGFSGAVEAHKKNRNESTIKIRTAGTSLGQIQEGRMVFAYSSRLLDKNTRETHARTRPLDLEYLGECEEKVDPATGAVPSKLGHSSMEGNSTLFSKMEVL